MVLLLGMFVLYRRGFVQFSGISKISREERPACIAADMLVVVVLCLLLSAPMRSAGDVKETFSLRIPEGPISAPLGGSVVLSCVASYPFDPDELQWYRAEHPQPPVLVYEKKRLNEELSDPRYRGRASLTAGLQRGDASLRLQNLTLADRGQYVCYTHNGMWYEEATVSLIVTVRGSIPVMSVSMRETGGQVNVSCVSGGWTPEPTLTWRDRNDKDINQTSNHVHSYGDDGLVRVSSWLLYSPSESDWLSCCVGVSDQERRESRILAYISTTQADTATNTSRAGTVAFIITLLLLMVLLLGMFVLYRRGFVQFSRISKTSQGERPACTGAEESLMPTGKEEPNDPTTDKATNTLITEMAEKETNTKNMIILTPEWDCLKTHEVKSIHLDTQTVPPFLEVNTEKMKGLGVKMMTSMGLKKGEGVKTEVWCPDPLRAQRYGDRAAHVLCEERFSSGQHCWGVKIWAKSLEDSEKKIKQKQSWYVGVCSDTVETFRKVPLTPQNGFWVLRYEKGAGLFANTDPPTPLPFSQLFRVLGVFLDCDKHTLSFYNVDTKSHLCTFENVGAGKRLIPLLSPGVRDSVVMRVCVDIEKEQGNDNTRHTEVNQENQDNSKCVNVEKEQGKDNTADPEENQENSK